MGQSLQLKNKIMSENQNNYVKWRVFAWSMGIVLILFGTCFTQITRNISKLDAYNQDFTDIKVQLSSIQTDIIWIKTNIR